MVISDKIEYTCHSDDPEGSLAKEHYGSFQKIGQEETLGASTFSTKKMADPFAQTMRAMEKKEQGDAKSARLVTRDAEAEKAIRSLCEGVVGTVDISDTHPVLKCALGFYDYIVNARLWKVDAKISPTRFALIVMHAWDHDIVSRTSPDSNLRAELRSEKKEEEYWRLLVPVFSRPAYCRLDDDDDDNDGDDADDKDALPSVGKIMVPRTPVQMKKTWTDQKKKVADWWKAFLEQAPQELGRKELLEQKQKAKDEEKRHRKRKRNCTSIDPTPPPPAPQVSEADIWSLRTSAACDDDNDDEPSAKAQRA